MLYNILKQIDENNHKINLHHSRMELHHSFLYNNKIIKYNSIIDFQHYLDIIITDTEIMLCGNNFYILTSDTIQDIEYMFENIYSKQCTLFLNQQDFNIIYIDKESGSIYGYISGGESYLIADNLLVFFDFICQIQEIIINQYHSSKSFIQEHYSHFLMDIRNIPNNKIYHIDFLIDFLYG